MQKILLIGAGGFIGSHLTEDLASSNEYQVTAIDINNEKLAGLSDSYVYHSLDLVKDKNSIERLIVENEIIVNLVAIANPGMYVKDPLFTFKLDFIENLWIVEKCVEYAKRLIHFSTSEVYGKSPAVYIPGKPFEFKEDDSNLILGPIKNHRWIYASSKQLLERVIHAYGLQDRLDYTIIRPFNYIGPKIDFLPSEEEGIPRVFSFFMDALLYHKTLYLVNGGHQMRCYTDIRDATAAHRLIIDNKDEKTFRQIINVGHRKNEISIKSLADSMINIWIEKYHGNPPPIEIIAGEKFYGKGYDDSDRRIPNSSKIDALGWTPRYNVMEILRHTMEYYYKVHRNHKN